MKNLGRELAMVALLVVLCAVVEAMNPRFLSATNLANMARLIGMYGIFSIGAAVVIITGGIDLSVGSMLALIGVLLSIALVEKHWPAWLAVGSVLAFGAALGAIHGFLITRIRLQPFVVTLCGLLIYRGLAQYIARDETKGFGESVGFEGLKQAATTTVLGVPIQFILLVGIAIIAALYLHKSVAGRSLFAAGSSEQAARHSGLPTHRIIASAYVISGLLAGVAAILLAFYTNSISPSSHGATYELYGIAAAVLGGCSLRGGEGSILGVLLGTALLQVLQNLVNLLGIPSSLNFAVVGAVILIGVIADRVVNRDRYRTS
jgi:ribose transport system permease protein